MRHRRHGTGALLILVATLLGLSLAGCAPTDPEFTEIEQVPEEQAEQTENGEGGGEGGAATALRFVAVDIDYSEAPASAPAGELAIELVNEGAIVHNVVFEGVDGDEPVVEAAPGSSAEGEVALDAGPYVYYCSVPGHREAGMEGELSVE